MQLTEEQVNQIAPDSPSIKAANKVFNKTNWDVKKSEQAVWASIKGSGKKPYLAQIDIVDLAFKCSCPSRKFPCKHGLAIGYYIASNGLDSINKAEEPVWVTEWITKRRNKKTTSKSAKPKKIASPEQKKKKSTQKWEKAVKSIEFLEFWLNDAVKLGIIELSTKNHSYWENLKRRMVDAQLPGINTFFNILQSLDNQDGWEETVLDILSQMHLLVTSIKNHKNLSPDVKQELELLLGWNINKNELLEDKNTHIVDDVWLVLNIEQSVTDNLESRKIYLYGVQTNQWAYILEFAFGNSFFKDSYILGGKFQAKLAIYPGVLKNRAILKLKGGNSDLPYDLKPFKNLEIAHDHFIENKIRFPWIFEQFIFLKDANIVKYDHQYFLVDDTNNMLKIIAITFIKYLSFLAESKGNKVDIFAVRTNNGIKILAFMANQKLVSL